MRACPSLGNQLSIAHSTKANWIYNVSAHTQKLLDRLDAIGQSLARTGQGLALLGLGSVGLERDRLDDYSDLDFFAIVAPGTKTRFMENLDWLGDLHPVAYAFMNTRDGYKLLYADDVFCEFAIFEPQDLKGIPFAAGKIVWQADGFDSSVLTPPPRPAHSIIDTEWQLGEALTNIYVGLQRELRGEHLSAQRFIQHFAVDRVLELAQTVETAAAGHADPFMVMRRYEIRFPGMSANLSAFIQGYDKNKESARAILTWLDAHFDVNAAIKARILAMCG